VPYSAIDAVLSELGEALAGKVVIDVTNRVKRPVIAESVDGTSAAEQIQRKVPKAKVAKAFNYAFAPSHADPKVDGVALDGFVAADDDDAKAKTLALIGSIGFRPIDAGPLAMARARGARDPQHRAPDPELLALAERLEAHRTDAGEEDLRKTRLRRSLPRMKETHERDRGCRVSVIRRIPDVVRRLP